MTALKTEKNIKSAIRNNFFKDYPWFYSNIYKNIQKSTDEFFQKDFKLRFMEISTNENILFYGDEYFVNKVPVTKNSNIKVKISANVVAALLDNTLGLSDNPFELKALTDIEAMLLKSFTLFTVKNIENCLNKIETNKKIIKNSKECSFTFYVQNNNEHIGKIILVMPDYLIPEIKLPKREERFTISDFKNADTNIKVFIGTAKTMVNDIKAIEDGDIIVLDESNINNMYLVWDDNKVKFRINPNPSLIMNIDNNGGSEMEEETSTKPQNMWDSILVDIVAEFDNVKLTLGELKQISEGLVIDVGSVYENKVKLRVENQVIAVGELVILNDRYGVRIDSVKKSKEAPKPVKPAVKEEKPAKAEPPSKQAKPAAMAKTPAKKAKNQQGSKGEDENFDYSDFEIEDESI